MSYRQEIVEDNFFLLARPVYCRTTHF